MNAKYKVIVFDLGGVLLDISGVQDILGWLDHKLTLPEFWLKWIQSPNVQAFEKGQMTDDAFVHAIIKEFELAVSFDTFKASYSAWIKGVFDGVSELILQLKPSYKLACLSNTNTLHWPDIAALPIKKTAEIQSQSHEQSHDQPQAQPQLLALFDHQFVSFKMGAVKPNADIYISMLSSLNVPPESVLFVDDNQINVDAAKAVGIDAYRTVGYQEITNLFKQLNVIDSTFNACVSHMLIPKPNTDI